MVCALSAPLYRGPAAKRGLQAGATAEAVDVGATVRAWLGRLAWLDVELRDFV